MNHTYKMDRYLRLVRCLIVGVVLLLSFSLLPATPAHAAARTASVTGLWSDNATWGGSSVPVAGDTVTINSGIMVTIPSGYAAAATSVAINANGSAGQNGLTFTDGTSSLALTAGVTMSAPTNASGSLFAVDAGTLTGATTLAINGGAAGMNAIFRISTGTAGFSGAITPGGTVAQTQITFTGAGTLNVGGTFGAPGTFTASTGTVNYNGAAQTAMVATYNNLTISGSLAKTFATTPTVNGVLSMEGTATITVTTGVVTYGASATLQYNSTHTATTEEWITPFVATGGVIINSGTITMGAAKVFNASVPLTINSGATLTRATFLLTLNGDLINNGGTVTSTTGGVTINGTADQSIGAFTITGAGTVSMTKASGTATFTGNVNSGGAFTLNGLGGTLDLGAGLTHTFAGTWTRTNGTLLGNSSTLNLNGTTSGAVATFTAGTSTVNYGGTGAQAIANVNYYNLGFAGAHTLATGFTINGAVGVAGTLTNSATFTTGNFVLTGSTFTFNGTGAQTVISLNSVPYVNLTLGGDGTKTITGITVNGIFSLADTATASAAPTYGAAATLRYNTVTARTAGVEWITPFAATGGVSIANTGTITMDADKVFNASVPLTVGSGATLASGNFQLTLGGNFVNSGGTFTAGTSTINYNGAAQTAMVTTYNNLTISGSLAKTFATTPTVNGVLSMEGTATITVTTGVVTYGASATLQYNSTHTATTEEWITPFVATGGVIINSGTITMGAAKVFNASVPLTINSGATLTRATFLLTLNGDLINNGGTVTSTTGGVTINGTADQSIGAFTITGAGTVSMTKASGTATFTGNVNGSALTINGAGGTLNLGVGLTHTFTGTWTMTAGTLDGGSSTLNLNGTTAGAGTSFTAGTSTVNYGGTIAQLVADVNYYNLGFSGAHTGALGFTINGAVGVAGTLTNSATFTTGNFTLTGSTFDFNGTGAQTVTSLSGAYYDYLTFSGSGVKSMDTGIAHTLSIAPTGSAQASVGDGLNLNVRSLMLGGVNQAVGTWGSTSSPAANQNDTYFAATTGYLTVTSAVSSTATGGAWATGATWVGGAAPAVGDNVTIATTGANSVTIGVAATCVGITIDSGATLTMTTFALRVNGPWVNNGTFNAGTATVTFGGATAEIDAGTGTGDFNTLSTPTTATVLTINTPVTAAALTTPANTAAVSITISGNNTLTVTGLVTMVRPGAGGTTTLAVGAGTLNAGSLTMTATTVGRNSILSISTGNATISGTFTANSTASTPGCQFTFSGAGTLTFGGTLELGATAGPTMTTFAGSTVTYSGAAQTVIVGTYNNLTLSGSGIKTVATTPTVNGVLSMEGTATITVTTGVVTYGGSATLQYNTTTGMTSSAEEWITPFTASGGVIIANTGTITLDAAKVFNASIPLTINSGATLDTGNFQLTFGGDFYNNGTFTAGSAPIVIADVAATQSIDGFITTGLVSMTKTAGTAAFTGNVSGAGFTLSGLGGTLDLGAGFTHTFTGLWTRTNGTLLGNSSTLNIGGTVTNTAGTFTAGTGTVNYNGAGGQTIATVTYNNLTLSGSGAKTTTGATVNGVLSREGTATTTGTVATYGSAATLQYKGSALQSTGIEFPATFAGTGGVIIDNAGGVNLSGSVAITYGLTLTSGTFAVVGNTLTLNGPTIAGTPANLSTTSSSSLVFGGSSSGVNLPGSLAALNNLTANNTNGITLNSSPTVSGTLTLAGGKIITGSNTLNIAAGGSISGGGAVAYVNGNLGKAFNTGAGQSFTFTVGDASNYTPVGIAGMSVSIAGNLTANTTAGDHPNMSTSEIAAVRSANRYWTLTAGGGLAVTTYNGTFNFVAGDVDGIATPSNFVVRKYAGAWSAPAGGSVAGATYTTGIGFTSFGDFAVAEIKITVTAVGLYLPDRTTPVTAMTPQVEYAIKVSATDFDNLSDLTSVVVTLYYDAGGTYNPLNIPVGGNTQTAAIMTDIVGGSPSWSIDPSASTTWSIISGNSTQPSLAGTSGDFWFHFKPGKVATATNGTGKWYIYARAVGPFSFGDNHQDDRTMNWYGEIIVNTPSVDFGSVAVGSDFTSNNQTGISVTYISNGPYSLQVKLSSPWTDGGLKMITLNAAGSPGSGEFAIKSHTTSAYASAVVVTTNYVTITTSTQTGESGLTVNTHTLWLKLGALGIPAVQYSGTVYYGIAP